MTLNGYAQVPEHLARVRLLVHDARMGLLDAEIELDEIERGLQAEHARRMQVELSKIDLTGPNADASARAAEEYRATGSSDPESYVPGGGLTA